MMTQPGSLFLGHCAHNFACNRLMKLIQIQNSFTNNEIILVHGLKTCSLIFSSIILAISCDLQINMDSNNNSKNFYVPAGSTQVHGAADQQGVRRAPAALAPMDRHTDQRWKWVSGSWVTASDPLTHDEITQYHYQATYFCFPLRLATI